MEKSEIEKFEDLVVWQEGIALSTVEYNLLKKRTDFGFRDQIRRVTVSIPSNITVGFDRQTNKEFIQFLHINKASCAEVRTQWYLAEKVDILSKYEVELLWNQTNKISAMVFRSPISNLPSPFIYV